MVPIFGGAAIRGISGPISEEPGGDSAASMAALPDLRRISPALFEPVE
jgi:hypothetical protein